MNQVQLYPPLFKRGAGAEFTRSGRTLSFTVSPRDASLAAFSTSLTEPKALKLSQSTQDIYTASAERVPSAERRLFLSDTSVIFAAFQNLRQNSRNGFSTTLGEEERYRMIAKLMMDYVTFAKEAWVHASSLDKPESLQYDADHYRVLYTALSLFVVLYVPDSGAEDVPIGEELMEWLNFNYIDPTSEEGDHLSVQDRPWEDETFWPYLTKTVLRGLSKSSDFFLAALSRHPSDGLRGISESLRPILSAQPRLTNFSTERDFVVAQRRWIERVKALRVALDRIPEKSRGVETNNWWGSISDIVGILEGRPEIIQTVCLGIGGDWKDLCAAWGIFVDHRLQRQDLPDIVGQVLESVPPDPTDVEDSILVALFSGQPSQALTLAAKFDTWLSAHWADTMEILDLVDDRADEETELSTRHQYVLAYADYLRSDPALWRITVSYLCSCGEIGRQRADEVLLRVPIQTVSGRDNDGLGEVPEILKEVVKTCFEYEREHIRRMVCAIAAKRFLRGKEYGLAISYMTTAEDWVGLGYVVDCVLEEYILHGPVTFSRLVATTAPSLQELRAHPGATGIFTRRLMFAVRYAEFHQRRLNGDLQDAALDLLTLFQQDIAPKAWWGILLCDATELLKIEAAMLFSSVGAVELLRRLEEIYVRTTQGSGDDYLSVLRRTMKGASEAEALRRLEMTRLTLAKYYGRCTMVGSGVIGSAL
ncbi:nucleoporin Nup85-like protein [Amylostereum chailletii]|nr:nucleoporin Nup85-like protein [Amylostereum chailletii]